MKMQLTHEKGQLPIDVTWIHKKYYIFFEDFCCTARVDAIIRR